MVKIPVPGTSGASSLGTRVSGGLPGVAQPDMVSAVRRAWEPWAQIAGGADQLAEVMKEQEDEKVLLDAQKRAKEILRERTFGEGGWTTVKGEDVYGLTGAVATDLDEQLDALGAEMSKDQRRAYAAWVQGQKQSTLDKVAAHEAGQREASILNKYDAAVGLAIEQAGDYWNDAAERERHIAQAQSAAISKMLRMGINPDGPEGQQILQAIDTDATETTYRRILAVNPAAAQDFIEAAAADGRIDSGKASALIASGAGQAAQYRGSKFGTQLATQGLPGTPVESSSAQEVVSYFFGAGPNIEFSETNGPLIFRESRGKTNLVSPKGASGMSQVMPENLQTSTSLGYGVVVDVDKYNAGDEDTQWKAGRDYLHALLTHPRSPAQGDVVLALMSYNWGPGNVERWVKNGMKWQDVPKETKDYVRALLPGYKAQAASRPKGDIKVAQLDAPGKTMTDAGIDAPAPDAAPQEAQPVDPLEAIRIISEIEDPREQAAAWSSYQRFHQIKAKAAEEEKNQLYSSAFQFLDKGEGSVDDFLDANPSARAALGPEIARLRAYEKQLADGAYATYPEEDELWSSIHEQLDTPEGRQDFIEMPLAELERKYKPSMSPQGYEALRAQHQTMRAAYSKEIAEPFQHLAGRTGEFTVDKFNKMINQAFLYNGVEKPDKREIAKVEARMYKWVLDEVNRRKDLPPDQQIPSPAERAEFARAATADFSFGGDFGDFEDEVGEGDDDRYDAFEATEIVIRGIKGTLSEDEVEALENESRGGPAHRSILEKLAQGEDVGGEGFFSRALAGSITLDGRTADLDHMRERAAAYLEIMDQRGVQPSLDHFIASFIREFVG